MSPCQQTVCEVQELPEVVSLTVIMARKPDLSGCRAWARERHPKSSLINVSFCGIGLSTKWHLSVFQVTGIDEKGYPSRIGCCCRTACCPCLTCCCSRRGNSSLKELSGGNNFKLESSVDSVTQALLALKFETQPRCKALLNTATMSTCVAT